MMKGGKRHYSVRNDAKWFAPPALPENQPKNRETCTSTGIMLSQVKSSLPQALNLERFPKWRTQQGLRDFLYSDYDKHALKDNISISTQSVGRRKCSFDRRQFNSNFCLCHDGVHSNTEEMGRTTTVYNADFMGKKEVDGPSNNRMFPRNHKQKSAESALAQAGQHYIWFGRHDLSPFSGTLQVPGETTSAAPAKL
ncbi:testis-expressed protein 36 [Cheilinus undulatus]|uniref:testis-expressed protein 36 n=1 Tax=Cheilinus undulatus TaxID=241271 RepID=UPI001BD283B5|nr:testis-expressed protein 36 [Cheilinus undulatus]